MAYVITPADRASVLRSYRLMRAMGFTPRDAIDRMHENTAADIACQVVILSRPVLAVMASRFAVIDEYRLTIWRRQADSPFWRTGQLPTPPPPPPARPARPCESKYHGGRSVYWYCTLATGHDGAHKYVNSAGVTLNSWLNRANA